MRKCFALLALAISAATTSADTTYSYTTTAANFDVEVGKTKVVQIFLHEVIDSFSISGDNGMSAASVKVAFSSGSTQNKITAALAGGSFGFGNTPGGVTATQVVLADAWLFGAPGPSPNGSGDLLLGTVTFTASATAGDVTTFSVGPRGSGNGWSLTFGPPTHDLDVTSAGLYQGAATTSFTITSIAPVPEPASMAMLGVVGAGGAFAAWRKRRRDNAPLTVA